MRAQAAIRRLQSSARGLTRDQQGALQRNLRMQEKFMRKDHVEALWLDLGAAADEGRAYNTLTKRRSTLQTAWRKCGIVGPSEMQKLDLDELLAGYKIECAQRVNDALAMTVPVDDKPTLRAYALYADWVRKQRPGPITTAQLQTSKPDDDVAILDTFMRTYVGAFAGQARSPDVEFLAIQDMSNHSFTDD